MNELLHPVEAIKYTTQGDYACSWCSYLIPVNRKNEIQEWCSAEVAGMFCSESHARIATINTYYRSRFAFNKEEK